MFVGKHFTETVNHLLNLSLHLLIGAPALLSWGSTCVPLFNFYQLVTGLITKQVTWKLGL